MGKSFVFWLGTGSPGDQQFTYHRPIGETGLDARDWVVTPTRDVPLLLMRRENEALAAWNRQAEQAKRRSVLAQGHGRTYADDGETEVWRFDGAPAIQPTIRTCIQAAIAAGAPESAWLNYADRSVQAAEQTFKENLRSAEIPPEWLAQHARPTFETRGGALGDVPQRAVEYLRGLSLAAAQDKVLRVAVGIDRPDAPNPP